MIIKKYHYLLILTVAFATSAKAQDSLQVTKKFINLSFIGTASTNGTYSQEMTNNVSLGLIHANPKNIYGFAFAPFNFVESSMYGLQIGLGNGAKTMKGLQIGGANGAQYTRGVQIGISNGAQSFRGVQIGLFNMKNCFEYETEEQAEGGLQIGLVNMADHNDFPIGLVNIIKDGDMNAGIYTDEMSNIMTTFRSGGRYLYGIVGLGTTFSSSEHHLVFEGGTGVHLHLTKRFRIDTEIVAAGFSVPMPIKLGESEADQKERENRHDFREAFRASARILPNIRLDKHFEVFGGVSVNYLHSNNVRNEKMFPSQYWWRKFESSCFKQIHLGWTVGMQYRF